MSTLFLEMPNVHNCSEDEMESVGFGFGREAEAVQNRCQGRLTSRQAASPSRAMAIHAYWVAAQPNWSDSTPMP